MLNTFLLNWSCLPTVLKLVLNNCGYLSCFQMESCYGTRDFDRIKKKKLDSMVTMGLFTVLFFS